MSNYLQKNPRLLLLIVGLILVSGSVAFTMLPRMEDPRLAQRNARVITIVPGADSMRVESLVTEKLENQLRQIEEIKELRSTSGNNISFINVALNDDVDETEAENVWSQVRDKAAEARLEMPAEAMDPLVKLYDATANALIVALKWELDDQPNYAILRRLVKQLKDEIDAIPGTEKSELVGAPAEEVLVTLDTDAMTAMNLSPLDISRAISASDAKVAAGLVRSQSNNLLLEVAGELDTLKRIGQIPVQVGGSANFVELGDVAKIEKTVKLPMDAKVVLQDKAAIALAVQIQPSMRLDLWSQELETVLTSFEEQVPAGISLSRVFEQSTYVNARMSSLLRSLVYGAGAIFIVILVMMGWRAAWIVGVTLPLVSLMVLSCMYWFGIPIHQMSITGLIIALGLMIDNAIVVVDEIAQRLQKGATPSEAIGDSISFLWVPLVGSTLTTVLSFSPIILMPGPAGEFVGSIAVVAVFAVICSLLLAMTVIATIAGVGLPSSRGRGWLARGISFRAVSSIYSWLVMTALRNPSVGILVALVMPTLGFIVALELPEQFFPPAERTQFQVEVELPASTSINETEALAKRIRSELLLDERIDDVKWFLGKSAPRFYYNVIPLRQNEANYAQGIVECAIGTNMLPLLREKQIELKSKFPAAAVVVRQLEQGPPFDAPIEVRLAGPDMKQLRELGNQVRLLLTQTPHVHYTRSSLSETSPKVSFEVDEQQSRLAGLNYKRIAGELNTTLEGITGGSIIEETEELPVRVRVSGDQRENLDNVASIDVLVNERGAASGSPNSYRGVPLSAISEMQLVPEIVRVPRLDGQRLNEVQTFIEAGVLPSTVLAKFRKRLAESDFQLPPGYKLSYGGAEAERDSAVGALVGNIMIIITLMIATMVISLRSFRLAALLFAVAGLSIGAALGSLWLAGYPWGFMSMVAMMGMIGVAVNDSIVVLAAIREVPDFCKYDLAAIRSRVVSSTRHVLSTTLTTIVGFTPLFLYGGEFWSPVAIAISGGVAGATVLALLLVPCAYVFINAPYIFETRAARYDEWSDADWGEDEKEELSQMEATVKV